MGEEHTKYYQHKKMAKCMMSRHHQSQKIIEWDHPWLKTRFLRNIALTQFSLFSVSDIEIRDM